MAYPECVGKLIRCSVDGAAYEAYLPKELPPSPLEIEKIVPLLDQATIALGRLDALSIVLTDPSLFPYLYIRKEAIFSSQIAGIKVSLSDLLLYESHTSLETPPVAIVGISHSLAAIQYILKRIQGGSSLSIRLMQEMHGILLSPNYSSSTGSFRDSPTWTGGSQISNAKFVPPPPEKIIDLLDNLEEFLQDKTLPVLIKAALAYYQFETIQPFLKGNGRLGRLLVSFVLCADGMVCQPLLYLSSYLKKHRKHCFEQMQLVRDTGNWQAWIEFFLKGVIETCYEGIDTAQTILNLFQKDENKIKTLGKSATSILIVHNYLQKYPYVNPKKIVADCKISLPLANKALINLIAMGIVKPTGRMGNKIYIYKKYLDMLDK